MLLADGFFQTANFIEAALWGVIGIGFVLYAGLPRTTTRRTPLIAAATFLAFGLSDVIEARTGAWWRPWWLLVWKGVCIGIFATMLWRYVVTRASRPH
jgi:hypothetical protein